MRSTVEAFSTPKSIPSARPFVRYPSEVLANQHGLADLLNTLGGYGTLR